MQAWKVDIQAGPGGTEGGITGGTISTRLVHIQQVNKMISIP
jgi:hypothetical protein